MTVNANQKEGGGVKKQAKKGEGTRLALPRVWSKDKHGVEAKEMTKSEQIVSKYKKRQPKRSPRKERKLSPKTRRK